MKTIELKKMGLSDISSMEQQAVSGGYTSFVYDLATFLRAHFQATGGNYAGLAKTAANWFVQQ